MRRPLLEIVLTALFVLPGTTGSAAYGQRASGDFDRIAASAEQARDANRADEAIALYRQALGLRPKWAEGWWYLGTLLYDREAFADAATALGEVTTLQPEFGSAWAMLGLSEFKLARFEDALAHIRKGRELGLGVNPQLEGVARYHEGLLLIGKGDFEHAQQMLAELSHDGAEDEDVTVALGLSALRTTFSELRAGDAHVRDLVRRVGTAERLAAQNRFADARAEYDRLVAESPKAPGLQYAYGRFLVDTNQQELAVAAFEREIENSPDHLPARVALADAKMQLRDFAGATPIAEQIVKMAPRLPIGHFLLGTVLVEAKQTARAVSELETARAGLPDEPKVYFQLGRAYAQAGRTEDAERARAEFARLNRQKPSSTP